ncbi:VOC family protein [Hyphomicrobium sp. 1Nfss2.1]|uniref:VOC family protein n=1 Tax=Hyphomicrobium sp. 1Nfss2.1 TaxID=3413936 RepID=UPI003C7D9FAB
MAVTFAPHLWYANNAEEAARFYASVIPASSVDRVTPLPAETPSGPAGSVSVVEFTLAGTPVMAISAGPHHEFNDAISLVLTCDTQGEIDRLWDGLLQGGGKPVQCGWLKDRYGVSWQIVPRRLGELIAHADKARAAAVTRAMLRMVKLDIAELEAAA